MSDLTHATRLARSAKILAQQVKRDDPTVVLLDPTSGEYYTLEAVGSRVWQLCDGTRTLAEMVATLSQEFEAAADVIESDVRELLKELVDEGLVQIVA
jgi:coenzyme PQQ biosynthesis protein PqqD